MVSGCASYNDRLAFTARNLVCLNEIETGLWPNPATDRVVVTYPKEMGEGGILRIYDTTGAIHFESDLEEHGAMEVNLEHLETGLYFVQLEYKSVMVQTLKLMVYE